MSERPVVSVVMIFLNAERFIREAIESVFAQTYPAWELLLVDDGSDDGSTEIARQCQANDPDRVTYLQHEGHENRGMSASRNLGIRNARGKYVAFLDADDVWMPEKLEQQVSILETHPDAGMVYGPTQYWHGWTGKRRDARKDFVGDLCVPSERLFEAPDLLEIYLASRGAALPGICSLVARRDAVDAVGGFEETFKGTYEDQVFLSKMCLSYPVYVTAACTDRYRQHPDSHCAIATQTGDYHPSKPNPARGKYLHWLGSYLSDQACDHEDLWAAYKQELRPYRHSNGRFPVLGFVSRLKAKSKGVVKGMVPRTVWQWLRVVATRGKAPPPVGWVRFGNLRRVNPISRDFGYDRGLPVDRYFIEKFLASHASDVRGRTLEVGEATYTQRFGGANVTRSDVLHVKAGHPGVTIVADLVGGDSIPSNAFDCFVCTQTLHLIYEIQSAIETIFRILKPGGVLLATFPGVSQIGGDEWSEAWSWGFSRSSARRLFENVFPRENVQVDAHGNVLVATAFLHGLAAEELRTKELEHRDSDYEFLITVRAVKPESDRAP